MDATATLGPACVFLEFSHAVLFDCIFFVSQMVGVLVEEARLRGVGGRYANLHATEWAVYNVYCSSRWA